MNARPRVVVDEQIPYLRGVLEPHAEVVYLPASAIGVEAVRHADALAIRTRTRCDAALLEGSCVRVVASATAGTDHIDSAYCAARGIRVVNAPGCNAWAVVQWVISCLHVAHRHSPFALGEMTVGIVGAGAIGSRLAATLEALGIRWMACDPPLARLAPERFYSLSDLARQCEVITLHTPYTTGGDWPTAGMIDRAFLRSLARRPYLFNAARGGIVDDYALTEALRCKWIRGYCLDVYEGEPDVPLAVLEGALVCTPHIAGYSVEGKWAATEGMLRGLCDGLGLPACRPAGLPDQLRPFSAGLSVQDLWKGFDAQQAGLGLRQRPHRFEQLRAEYPLRHDWRGYELASRRLQEAMARFEG